MSEGFFRRRVVAPILTLLKTGVTPDRMALSLACGLTVGVFPVLGATTLLCTIVALGLGLNLPAIQLVNYLAYPIHIALLLPFIRLGEILFRRPHLPLTLNGIGAMLRDDTWAAIGALWGTELRAVVAWALVAPPATYVLYLLLVPLMRRLLARAVAEGSA